MAGRQLLRSVGDLPDRSTEADSRRATVAVLAEGWPDDLRTCLTALLEHLPPDVVVFVLDIGDVDGAAAVVESAAAGAPPGRVQAWHVRAPTGWGAARRALLRADVAAVHVWCEVSTVFTGDALGPLLAALDDPSVVAAGWQGVDVDRADAWRSVHPAGPGEVDALLGYLFAMRRAAALAAGGPHPKARYYRNGDLEFSFALRAAAGGRLVVPPGPLPLRQTRHHGYHDVDPAYRERESARTYRRLLTRFRDASP